VKNKSVLRLIFDLVFLSAIGLKSAQKEFINRIFKEAEEKTLRASQQCGFQGTIYQRQYIEIGKIVKNIKTTNLIMKKCEHKWLIT
jgi:hypothetical protein